MSSSASSASVAQTTSKPDFSSSKRYVSWTATLSSTRSTRLRVALCPSPTASSTPSNRNVTVVPAPDDSMVTRSEEHTSELQSHSDLVCRLLLEKKNEQCQLRCL